MEINKKCVGITSAVVVGLIILVVIISVSVSGSGSSSTVTQTQTGGGFSSQEQTVNGVTKGSCSYQDAQGRVVKLTYTITASGQMTAEAEQSFVSNPEAEVALCKKAQNNFDFDSHFDSVFGDNQGGVSKRETRSVGSRINGGNTHVERQRSVQAAPLNAPVHSQTVSQTFNGGGAQHQEVIQNGVMTGTCSYVDKKGRSVTVTYKKRPNGKVKVESKDTFVTKPMRAYRSCMAAVRSKEGRANGGRTQNSGSQSQTVSQSSFGGLNGGAQNQEVTQNGVTTGTCSYVDTQGRHITLTYRKKSNGKIKAKSEDPSVVKPKKALKACKRAVKIQEKKMQAEMSKMQQQVMEQILGSMSGK